MPKFVKTTGDKDEKKCPLFYHSGMMMLSDCVKEDCMFWLDDEGQCSIPVLARQALGMRQSKSAEPASVVIRGF
jgi:hypothetical protein